MILKNFHLIQLVRDFTTDLIVTYIIFVVRILRYIGITCYHTRIFQGKVAEAILRLVHRLVPVGLPHVSNAAVLGAIKDTRLGCCLEGDISVCLYLGNSLLLVDGGEVYLLCLGVQEEKRDVPLAAHVVPLRPLLKLVELVLAEDYLDGLLVEE